MNNQGHKKIKTEVTKKVCYQIYELNTTIEFVFTVEEVSKNNHNAPKKGKSILKRLIIVEKRKDKKLDKTLLLKHFLNGTKTGSLIPAEKRDEKLLKEIKNICFQEQRDKELGWNEVLDLIKELEKITTKEKEKSITQTKEKSDDNKK